MLLSMHPLIPLITALPSSKMHPFLLYSLAVLLFSISTLSFPDIANEAPRGFSVDLIHRDSPLFSPLCTTDCPDKSYESSLQKSNYTYLMKIKVSGDEKFATLDTGSNMIWFNGEDCEGNACTSRTKIKPTDPPQNLCKKCSECEKCRKKKCTEEKKICPYNATYGDNFTTGGVLTRGTFSFPCSDGKERKFRKIWFGISDFSNGTFESKSAGVVGLARGELSLIEQLCVKGKFDSKFSYCLPKHRNSVSKLSFGDHVTISEGKSVKLLNTESGYYVNLKNIHVNENEEIKVSEKNQKILIDSGTTATYLNSELFHRFSDSVKKEIGKEVLTSKIEEFDVCFKHGENVKIPTVKFGFEGKSSEPITVELKQENFLHEVSYENTKWLCLMVMDRKDEHNNILGSWAQTGFMVAFDITRQEVSFDPHDCDQQKVESLAFDITRQEVSFDPRDFGKEKVESLHSQE